MAFENKVTNNTNLKTVTEEDVAYDDCYNTNCKYYNTEEEMCTYETCIFKEIPKHPREYTHQCIICDTTYSANIEDLRLPVCPECLTALRHIVIAHRNYCSECQSAPIENESDIDQYLQEGEDGSNEDWNI